MKQILLASVIALGLSAPAHAYEIPQQKPPDWCVYHPSGCAESVKEVTKAYDECVFAGLFVGNAEAAVREDCRKPEVRNGIATWWRKQDMEAVSESLWWCEHEPIACPRHLGGRRRSAY
jgi:hypothetical protein